MAKIEKHSFGAEVGKILQLMIHSLYENREIFLRELVSNASDACDTLRYQAITKPELIKDDSELKISISADVKKKTLTIKDNGIGITPKFKEKIFDMYKRLHNQSEFSGTGLGLSIVKILTKKMNGTIELESSSSTGSTFKLSLPK